MLTSHISCFPSYMGTGVRRTSNKLKTLGHLQVWSSKTSPTSNGSMERNGSSTNALCRRTGVEAVDYTTQCCNPCEVQAHVWYWQPEPDRNRHGIGWCEWVRLHCPPASHHSVGVPVHEWSLVQNSNSERRAVHKRSFTDLCYWCLCPRNSLQLRIHLFSVV